MKVKELREILEDAINTLNQYEDNQDLTIESNTYWLRDSRRFISIRGYGFIDLDCPIEKDIDFEEEE